MENPEIKLLTDEGLRLRYWLLEHPEYKDDIDPLRGVPPFESCELTALLELDCYTLTHKDHRVHMNIDNGAYNISIVVLDSRRHGVLCRMAGSTGKQFPRVAIEVLYEAKLRWRDMQDGK